MLSTPHAPGRSGRFSNDRVHGIARRKAQDGTPLSAKGLQHLLDHFIGPVCGPHHRGIEGALAVTPGRVAGQGLPQCGEFSIGVAVNRLQRAGNMGENRLPHLWWDGVSIFIDIQRIRHRIHRGAIRLFTPEVISQR